MFVNVAKLGEGVAKLSEKMTIRRLPGGSQQRHGACADAQGWLDGVARSPLRRLHSVRCRPRMAVARRYCFGQMLANFGRLSSPKFNKIWSAPSRLYRSRCLQANIGKQASKYSICSIFHDLHDLHIFALWESRLETGPIKGCCF